MTQSEMLKLIARHGYNVGFGAKKNFATYDLICKASGWISFISLAVGVFALFIPELATNVISAILIIFGVATMYIQFYDSEKQSYESAGIEQTKIFNELEVIYRNVKSDANFDYQRTQQSIDAIMSRFYGTVISKQIFGSNTEGQNPAFALLSRQSGDHFYYSCHLENALMLQPMKNSAS